MLLLGCVHSSESFSVNILHNNEEVRFEQDLFSKGSFPVTMGHPGWGHRTNYEFDFELDNIDDIYYGYLSIVTWDVEWVAHEILLNAESIGYLPISKVVDFGPTPGGEKNIPKSLGDTQIYLPKQFFKKGINILKIYPRINTSNKYNSDTFTIKDLDIVIVKVIRKSNKNNFEQSESKKRYFPKRLKYLSVLTDEELYISTVQLPDYFTEINFQYGVNTKKLSYTYSKIGDYYRWKGDFYKNLLYQKKAVETESKDGNTPLLPYLKAQLALAHYYLGNYEISIYKCNSALLDLSNVDKRKLKNIAPAETENPELLKSLIYSYLALNYYQLNEYNSSESFCNKIESGFPVATAIKYQVIGNLTSRKDEHENAIKYYRAAIAILSKNSDIFHDNINDIMLLIANEKYLLENYNDALSVLKSIKEPTHHSIWKSNLLMGNIFYKNDNVVEAINKYRLSLNEIESARSRLNYYGFKINFMNDKQEPYRKIIPALIRSNRNDEAFFYVEKSKARAFLDLLIASNQKVYGKNTELKNLSDEEKQLREKLIDTQRQIDNEKRLFKNRGVNDDTKKRLALIQKNLNEFYENKAFQNIDFQSLSTAKILNLTDIMAILPADTSLVEYYYDEEYLYVWILDKNKKYFIRKRINRLKIESMVRSYRRSIEQSSFSRGIITINNSVSKSWSFLKGNEKLIGEISEIFINNVFDKIENRKVYIIPHNIAHYLPFQSLQFNSQYLVNQFEIGYLPSSTSLKYVIDRRKEKSNKILAIGNPDLGSKKMNLPYAEKEVLKLKEKNSDTMILIGKDATETAFKKYAADFDIIHIASHGEFNIEYPLFSCLRLGAGQGEDGRLETSEIFNQNLNSYLVVLSACNTALGKLTNGDELIGLSRAFIFAGTPSILGTIWSVNDKSTSIFMDNFYQNLKTMNKFKALQQAQIAMINSKEYHHPYHWAGFQLIGDYY
jgi:CHAT domain-containing protein